MLFIGDPIALCGTSYVTGTSHHCTPGSDIYPVNDLLPSAEEAVADIRVWTVHSDTNALAISAYSTSYQTFVYVLRLYRYSHDHPCASRRDDRTQRGHCV